MMNCEICPGEEDTKMTDMVPFEPIARLNITINGENGDYPDPVNHEATDGDIKQIAVEAIHTGYIPGIAADAAADLTDFVVDRYPATNELPPRLMLRPKTPFGPEAAEEEEGIKAIIHLQGMAEKDESRAQAQAGWRGMNEAERASTIRVYETIIGSGGS